MELLSDSESGLDCRIVPLIRQSLNSLSEFMMLATGMSF